MVDTGINFELTALDFLSPGLFIALGSLAIIQLVLIIAAIISLVRKKVPSSDKILWLLLILLINIIGPIIYFAIGSSKLDDKAASMENEERR